LSFPTLPALSKTSAPRSRPTGRMRGRQPRKGRWTLDRSRAKPTRCRGRRSLTEASYGSGACGQPLCPPALRAACATEISTDRPAPRSRAGRARPRRARGRRRAVGGPIGKDGRATPLASPSHCRRTAETARGRCSQCPADRGEGCPEALAGSMVGAAGEPGVAQARPAGGGRRAGSAGRGGPPAGRRRPRRRRCGTGRRPRWRLRTPAMPGPGRPPGTPALLRGMGYPQPAATRAARRPANSAATADTSPATTAS